jgi:hypothetical protein
MWRPRLQSCAAVWQGRDAQYPVQPASLATIGERQGGTPCPDKLRSKRTPTNHLRRVQ